MHDARFAVDGSASPPRRLGRADRDRLAAVLALRQCGGDNELAARRLRAAAGLVEDVMVAGRLGRAAVILEGRA